jgi:UDP-3-O-[3-hydroxymyristoyl] glucosamine N-acyltransferase
MDHKLKIPISASSLSKRLGLTLIGENISIFEVCSLDSATNGGLCFSKVTPIINDSTRRVIIGPQNTSPGSGAVIVAPNPRLSFARALNIIAVEPGFIGSDIPAIVDPSATVSSTATIGNGVKIGARTVIGHNVVISDGVTIGSDCIIKSNTVIGEAGFGFERDEMGVPIRILHLGTVKIGDRVEIGSLNTICRATLGTTVIEDDVKTDDHVHIAHNCRVRRGAMITACVELSGGVDVGSFAWVGPNSSIIQKLVIGDHAFIGIGSNVTKSVPNGVSVAGNPARMLTRLT